ncbi:MAG: hypothetical protein N2234_01365 [Planctomycetota bacterium]|nr:hypothetical protein [Planctomycetota bacterium]
MREVLWIGLLVVVTGIGLEVRAEEGARASIEFSDGTKKSGFLSNTNDEPLRIYSLNLKKWQRIPLCDIVSIEMEVEKKEKLQAWRFKEEGKPEKVYLDKWYWRLHFVGKVTLKTGERVDCHISAVLHLRIDDRSERLWLERYHKTEEDETPDDVVYVKRILFEGAKVDGEGEGCKIFGDIEPANMVKAVRLMRHSVGEVYEGGLNDNASKYVVKNLPPGVYDLFLLTENQVFVALGLEGEGVKEGLNDEDKSLIARAVAENEDFYETKEVMCAVGGENFAKVLVRKIRKGRTTLEKKDEAPLQFLAFEALFLKKSETRWHIVKRMVLHREKFGQHEEKEKMKEVVILEGLGNKDLNKEKSLRYDVVLSEKK